VVTGSYNIARARCISEGWLSTICGVLTSNCLLIPFSTISGGWIVGRRMTPSNWTNRPAALILATIENAADKSRER
jgi:hypothetical protein